MGQIDRLQRREPRQDIRECRNSPRHAIPQPAGGEAAEGFGDTGSARPVGDGVVADIEMFDSWAFRGQAAEAHRPEGLDVVPREVQVL